MPNPGIQSLLRERIDDLSTRLLIGDAGPEILLAAFTERGIHVVTAWVSGRSDATPAFRRHAKRGS